MSRLHHISSEAVGCHQAFLSYLPNGQDMSCTRFFMILPIAPNLLQMVIRMKHEEWTSMDKLYSAKGRKSF